MDNIKSVVKATSNNTNNNNTNCHIDGRIRVEWDIKHSTESNLGFNQTNTLNFKLKSSTLDRIVICQGISFVTSVSASVTSQTSKGMFINIPYYFFCNHIVYYPRSYDTFGGYSYRLCIIYKNQTHIEKCEPSPLEDLIFNTNNTNYTHEDNQLNSFFPMGLTASLNFDNRLLPGLDKDTFVQLVFKRGSGLQEFQSLFNNETYSEEFLEEEHQFLVLGPLNLTQSYKWEPECNALYFQTRPFYNIWKGISCFIVAIVSISLLVMLIIARKNRYIQSRFFSPYFSTLLFFLASSIRFGFVMLSSDNYYMNLVMTALLIFVFSLYTLQTVRYFLCRWFYRQYYASERKETFWFRMISSKTTYIICAIILVGLEIILIYLVSAIQDTIVKNDILDYLTIAAFAVMIILSLGSTLLYLLTNRGLIKQLGSFMKVVKWYFIFDDTFKYHAEFLAIILTALTGLLYFVLSTLNGSYMAGNYFLPVSNMMATHLIGYALYGISKTIFEVCLVSFEPGFLLLIYWFESRQPTIEFEGLKNLKAEMELFLANEMDDIPCVDIMKRFLAAEFRAELLEIYFFISRNSNFSEEEITTQYPNYILKSILNAESTSFKLKESLESNLEKLGRVIEESNTSSNQYPTTTVIDWRKKFISLVTFQMIDAFSRLKQTPTYKTHYLGMKEFENQFVSKVLGRVASPMTNNTTKVPPNNQQENISIEKNLSAQEGSEPEISTPTTIPLHHLLTNESSTELSETDSTIN